MRKIILHIGSPKCGSTYLQCAMKNNMAKLKEHGVSYPQPYGNHPGNGADIGDITQAGFDQLFENADTVVLSHEDLFLRPTCGDALAQFAQTADVQVQVVAFMRPYSQFLFGDYSQFMKQHFETFLKTRRPYNGRNFEQFAVDRSHALKPVPSFKAWQRLFPDTPLLIDSHKNIKPVFEGLLNISDLDWVVHHDRTNPSLRMEDCDRVVRAILDPDIADSDIRQMFQNAFKKTKAGDAGKTDERIAWIEALFSKQNQNLMDVFSFDNRL